MRKTVAKWKDLFADPRFPLPESVIPSAAVEGTTKKVQSSKVKVNAL